MNTNPTTKEYRDSIRRNFSNLGGIIRVLDDFDHLESQLQESRALLERAYGYMDAVKIALSDNHTVHRWLADYSALKSRDEKGEE
jgi:hypothetical protein